MKNIKILLLLLLPAIVAAQSDTVDTAWDKPVKFPAGVYLPLDPLKYHLMDRLDIKYDSNQIYNLFTATKPYNEFHVLPYYMYIKKDDPRYHANKALITADYLFDIESEKPILKYFYRHPSHLLQVNEKDFQLAVNPILHFEIGKESGVDLTNFYNSRGLELYGNIARRIGFYTNIIETQANPPVFVDDRVSEFNLVFPEAGRTKPFKENSYDFLYASGYITVKPFKQLDIQFGQDKNFIGDGIRSLMLSDFSNNYLFLKLNTKVWKLNYQNIFAELIDYRRQNISDGYVPRKFAAFHHLSIDPIKNLTIGLFESVVYGDEDSTLPRQFELHYLNPLIFYRAIEFQLGSSDNVIIGLDWKYNFLQRFSFYGQVIIDDMIYWEFLKGTGWWGNKYGLQAGLKYIDAFGIPHLDLQGEFNTVSPYTYSHNKLAINYTHFSQPLAHPLGANFRELIGAIYYQPHRKIYITAVGIYADQGVSSNADSLNFGDKIFWSNTTRVGDYENTIGQGYDTDIFMMDMTISYLWKYNIFLDLRWIYRKVQTQLPPFDISSNYIGVAFRMNFSGRKFFF